MLVNVDNGTSGAQNIVYDGKLKLPELRQFMEDFALPANEAKQDYVIASKKRKESSQAQRLKGLRIVESVEEMKDFIMDDPLAALVYAAQREQAPHLALVEQLGQEYGEFINIVALIVDDPQTVKKEMKGKLPLFRFYKNELKG